MKHKEGETTTVKVENKYHLFKEGETIKIIQVFSFDRNYLVINKNGRKGIVGEEDI